MNFKKFLKIFSIILSIAAVAGVVYLFVERYLNRKSIESDNKVQYVSFNSEDDEFIAEPVEEKLA
ncbi:MAG: hypothetical protein RR911_05965 [Oscillospiraceae bacterium]